MIGCCPHHAPACSKAFQQKRALGLPRQLHERLQKHSLRSMLAVARLLLLLKPCCMMSPMWPMGVSTSLHSGHLSMPYAAVSSPVRSCVSLRGTQRRQQRAAAVQECSLQCRGHSWQRRKRWPQRCSARTLPLDEVSTLSCAAPRSCKHHLLPP